MRYLNGDLFYYCEDIELNQTKFFHDFRSFLSKDCAWESVFRLRISENWNVKTISGNYAVISTDLLSVGNIDENQCLIYDFEMKDEPVNDSFYMQVT